MQPGSRLKIKGDIIPNARKIIPKKKPFQSVMAIKYFCRRYGKLKL